MPFQAPAPQEPNVMGHPDRTPKFDPKFDIVKQANNPFGRDYDINAALPPHSAKAPIIRGGSIPEIQDDIVKRDRKRMDKAFWDEQELRRGGQTAEQRRLEREQQEKIKQRENDIREMSELDRRTPKYGKFEGFPLSPPPGWDR